ncbi:MAG: aldehyde dehydrogenase family protein [Gammaproteobacteria bacterium]
MKTQRSIDVRNPRNGQNDYAFTATSEAELDRHAAVLRGAQGDWQANGVAARVAVLREFHRALSANADAIIDALSVDTGRLTTARGEFYGTLASIEGWCQLAPSLLASQSTAARSMADVTIEQTGQPYPLLGAISPWNFPLLLSFIDVTPALLAGCAAIVKPSEVTPRFVEPVTDSINRVPALRDVLRLCPGDGETGAALIDRVDVVAFTGSVATGKTVLRAAANAFIPAFLELGGKDPAIVLDRSDLERASTALLRASVAATGQACQSIERIYVHENVFDSFVETLVTKARDVPFSYPDPHSGILGPLIFERQADIIQSHIDDATAKGATVLTGGRIEHHGGGAWIAPTVLTGVTHQMRVMTDETFGPLMPIMSFAHEDEAIALANDSNYGLSAAVFGPTMDDATRVARRLKAGGISVNEAGLTTRLFETEKSTFGYSGMGPSRVGPSGLTRFVRRQSLYQHAGNVMPVDAFKEDS